MDKDGPQPPKDRFHVETTIHIHDLHYGAECTMKSTGAAEDVAGGIQQSMAKIVQMASDAFPPDEPVVK